MKNIKIKFKLIISFGIILILLVTLGLISFFSIKEISKIIDNYNTKTIVNISHIDNIRNSMSYVEKYLLYAITSPDKSEIDNYIDLCNKERDNLDNYISLYKANMRTNASLIENFERIIKSVASYRLEMFDLAKENTQQSNNKALDIYIYTYSKTFSQANDILADISDEIHKLALSQQKESKIIIASVNITVVAVLFLSITFAIIIIIIVTKAITNPILEIESAARDLANGQLNTNITYQSQDELGSLANSMRSSIEIFKIYISDIDIAMTEMSNNNFDIKESQQPFIGDFKSIEISIKKLITRMSQTISNIKNSAEQVSNSSEQISISAQEIANGATDQASSIEELSASITEVSNQVNQNAANSKMANEMSTDITNSIKISNQQMQNLINCMDTIKNKSKQISTIIKTIEDIAFQTNILSLNAMIEVARAGEAGRGFAVVANEVKKLANKSSEAVKDTTRLIEDSINAVTNGVEVTNLTANTLNKIIENIISTTSLISGISTATNEQAYVLSQVSLGIDQISSVVQLNSAISEESATASQELLSQANVLKEIVSNFKIKKNHSNNAS